VDKAERALRLADEIAAETLDRATPRRELTASRLAQAEAALAQAKAKQQAHHDDWCRREAATGGRGLPGARPSGVEEHIRVRQAAARVDAWRQRLTEREAASGQATGKRNITDPDSRIMPVKGGFVLSYNSQLAVGGDHLILAANVVPDTGDAQQLTPMLDQLAHAVDTLREATNNPELAVGCALFDAGYASVDNLSVPGPDRLIALGKRNKIAGEDPPTSPPGHNATAQTEHGLAIEHPSRKALYNNAARPSNPSTDTSKTAEDLKFPG
jgi:hypothetical protein